MEMERTESRQGAGVDTAVDAELVVLSQRGDVHAFNKLAAQCNDSLYRFVRRMLGNSEDARDLSQEALIKAYVNIPRLRDPAKFRPWLHHIALNLCRDWHRSARVKAKTEPYAEGAPEETRILERARVPAAPDVSVERANAAEILGGCLAALPWEQRTAIVLREYQGFTSDEIAQITGVSAATVRTRIFYGLKAIRRRMNEQGITPERLQGGGGWQ
jgi:RNA polymerase sigma-70 factor (ECF subfamily)